MAGPLEQAMANRAATKFGISLDDPRVQARLAQPRPVNPRPALPDYHDILSRFRGIGSGGNINDILTPYLSSLMPSGVSLLSFNTSTPVLGPVDVSSPPSPPAYSPTDIGWPGQNRRLQRPF